MQELEEHFEKLSKMIRKEMKRFDAQRVRDFKLTILQYLEALATTQQQVKFISFVVSMAKRFANKRFCNFFPVSEILGRIPARSQRDCLLMQRLNSISQNITKVKMKR